MASSKEFSKLSSDTDCVLDLTCTSEDKTEESNPVNPAEIQKRRGPRKSRKRRRDEEEDDDESESRRLLANTQERVRMQRLNVALEELKKALPPHFHTFQKRLSKIRTLRLAMNYIATLSDLIQKDNARREAAYRQTLQYVHEQGRIPQFSVEGALVSSINPYVPDQRPMTPALYIPTIATPFHAYLGTLHGLANTNSFETPVQTPPRHQPRQLKFHTVPDQTRTRTTETLVAGSTETPVKPQKDNFVLINPGSFTSEISKLQSWHKTETFTSPLVGSRNQNELDLSFLSTGSDGNRDDVEGAARVTSLEDIIDGDDEQDDAADSLAVQM